MLCWRLHCQHSCQYFVWTLISFLISFSVFSFSISIFVFNNFILYYFFCCVDDCNVDTHANILLCQHSCQYFVWTLISFLISFSVTSFSMSIFLFNNFILYYFCCYFDHCNVGTHANIQPRGQLSEHMYCLYWRTVQLLRDRTVRSASVKKCPHTDRPQTGGLFNRDFFLIQLKCWRSCQYFFLFLTVCANGWAFKTLSDPSP